MQPNLLEISMDLSTESLSLIDIEPPVAPEFNWSIWGEWSLWLLVVLLILGLLLKWGSRLYKPAHICWKLIQLTPSSNQDEFLPVDQAWRLYGVCLQIKPLISPAETSALQAFDRLMEQINHLCFSSQPVSRETYLQLLTQSKSIVAKNSSLRLYINPLLMALKAKLKGSR